MQNIEPNQGALTDQVSAQKELPNLLADDGDAGRDMGADRNGPKGELVPRQEIAGETEKQGQHQKHHAQNPVEWPIRADRAALLVGTGEKDPEHV